MPYMLPSGGRGNLVLPFLAGHYIDSSSVTAAVARFTLRRVESIGEGLYYLSYISYTVCHVLSQTTKDRISSLEFY